MRIDFVDIVNFRKLRASRVGLSKDKTVFVGANNSGKTSAMDAFRYFLLERNRSEIVFNDFTLSRWPAIDKMGKVWEDADAAKEALPDPTWDDLVPFLDVWLHVEDDEIHYVQKILPTMDWEGGRIGVRLRFEPKDPAKLQKQYLADRAAAKAVQQNPTGTRSATDMTEIALWPRSLTDFLKRRIGQFGVCAYVLDPAKCGEAEHGEVKPQALAVGSEPIEGNPFKGLIQIHEISAQRGLGREAASGDAGDDADDAVSAATGRILSAQLRQYYNHHLDPNESPDANDLEALRAIASAEKAFDTRLKEGFAKALKELEKLGYPGVTDPQLHISTQLKPIDGLNHRSAVQYIVEVDDGGTPLPLHLPELSNGLGYQNLISMVFWLMAFRDHWMRVGKRAKAAASSESPIPPLQIVLIEEPEAHLHTQVQQVFIRQAYDVLRNHENLKGETKFTTQMVVSTHSSHIAHECTFDALRYFRRMPAPEGDIPTSCVTNLGNVFGGNEETKRFVTRYLKVTHCDLFFADAAVLIEGPAERILVPHLIQSHNEFEKLSESYITWLEIGGSHAHRFKPLITSLGLTTLVITDLDAVDDASDSSVVPKRGQQQKSRNATLKTWCPETDSLDELLAKPEDDKVKTYTEEQFSIRVAYQCPVTVSFNGADGEALANTLEDALVFENIEFFRHHDGSGLFKRLKKAIAASSTVPELGEALFKALKSGGKAELALDLLELDESKKLRTPHYIRMGLLWLAQQLRKQHEEIGVLSPAAAATDGTGKAS